MPTDTTMLDLCSIIEQAAGVRLSYIASSHGGEFAGSCPWCSGTDRFRVWPNAPKPHYWCRGCNRRGDAIAFLRETQGLSYHEACERLGVEPGETYAVRKAPLAQESDQPPAKWQGSGTLLVSLAETYLWKHAPEILDYLHQRGLTDETIKHARLGYIPAWKTFSFDDWGLTDDMLTEAQQVKGGVKIPDGILIPWYVDGILYKLTVKRPFAKENELKYGQIVGSKECLYNAGDIEVGKPVVMSEAVIDALSAWQGCRDLAVCVATDSIVGARTPRWIAYLAMSSCILLAFDVDANQAGAKGVDFWLSVFPEQAFRLPPWRHDLNDMLKAGLDIREWLTQGVSVAARPLAMPEPLVLLPVSESPHSGLYVPADPFTDWQEWLPEQCSIAGCTRAIDEFWQEETGDITSLCYAHFLARKHPPCGLCGSTEWLQRPTDGQWVCKPCWLTLSTHKPAPEPVATTPKTSWKDYWSK